jgi:succinate-acetate transporter protein
MAQQNGRDARFDEKVLRMAEEGIVAHGPHVSVPKAAPGLGNPAPLGLLCFGMTTGKVFWLLWGLDSALVLCTGAVLTQLFECAKRVT